MDRPALALLALLLIATAAVLALRLVRAARRRGAARAAYLDDCAMLLGAVRRGRGATGFARICGQYRGQTFDVQAVPDTLNMRKLPALWVLVTLPVPTPLRATLDVMIRPTGIEPFSNFGTLPEQIVPPAGFPEDCTIRTDATDALPPASLLAPHLDLFDQDRIKELVLSPKGLRITMLAEEANRGRYLIFRDAEMGLEPLPRDAIAPLLDRLLALHGDILAAHGANDSPQDRRRA